MMNYLKKDRPNGCGITSLNMNNTLLEKTDIACDHYHRYAEDIRLMKEAGLNAYRFSIEWARIQPEEGVFDDEQIDHYRKVIRCCRENGIEPIVTLFHFSSPVWIIRKGGWEAETVVEDFEKYVAHVINALGNELNYVCTINEANMGLQVAAISRRYTMMAKKSRRGQREKRRRRGSDGPEHASHDGKYEAPGLGERGNLWHSPASLLQSGRQ